MDTAQRIIWDGILAPLKSMRVFTLPALGPRFYLWTLGCVSELNSWAVYPNMPSEFTSRTSEYALSSACLVEFTLQLYYLKLKIIAS